MSWCLVLTFSLIKASISILDRLALGDWTELGEPKNKTENLQCCEEHQQTIKHINTLVYIWLKWLLKKRNKCFVNLVTSKDYISKFVARHLMQTICLFVFPLFFKRYDVNGAVTNIVAVASHIFYSILVTIFYFNKCILYTNALFLITERRWRTIPPGSKSVSTVFNRRSLC